MLIVYDSLTGNVERFVSKLNMKNIKINQYIQIDEPYILITYTAGFGRVPYSTTSFLMGNSKYIQGVAVSGNRNWGLSYGQAGKTISVQFQVPLLMTFELSGTEQDINRFKEEVKAVVDSKVHRT
jgi:protein involved in ribonucleotide reduction